jgi:hypothetical protein
MAPNIAQRGWIRSQPRPPLSYAVAPNVGLELSMANMSDLAVAVARLQEARQTITEFRDAAEFQERRIEFLGKLLDATNAMLSAQEERSALLDRARQLEKEVERLEGWEAKKERYELISLAPNVVARAPKQGMEGSEAPHYLCANCFAANKEMYLQKVVSGQYWDRYNCKECGDLSVDKGNPPMPSTSRRGGHRGPGGWMAS